MRSPYPPRFPRLRPKPAAFRGFALVVTVSLMVLLAIMAVGLLSLSTISLRRSSLEAARAEAQANARMALMLAIGQLQVELGPDQRVNASADLKDGALTDGRQRWVGSWESWPAGAKDRPEPRFRSWLVSGKPDQVLQATYPSAASDLVTLMRGNSTIQMSAPRVALKQGGFAYAISDESAKARLGPATDTGREDLAEHLIRYQTPAAGHGALPGLDGVPRNTLQLDQIVSSRTVDLVPGSATANQRLLRPDSYTVWSEGLLTDVRNGGFRKDLSLHFHRPESGNSSQALYQQGSRRGINFRELRDFHEVSSRITYDAANYRHFDGGSLNRDVPCLVGKNNGASAATDPFFAYLRPVVIRGSWHISAFSRKVGTAADSPYRIFIVLEPIIWLWNPFDANLVMQPGGHLTVRCWGLPYSVTIKAGTTNRTVHFNNIRQNQGDNIAMEIGQNTPVVMRPGEVLIFSRGREATTPIDQFARFEGKQGWSGTGGFSLDTGIQVPASGQVTISMKPSTTRGATRWGLIEFLSYVGSDANNQYWNGGLMIDRADWQGEITAAQFPPEMFREVPDRTFSSAANLTTPEPVALFSYFARTERDSLQKSRYLARLNPGAMGYDHQSVDANTLHSLTYEPHMQPLNGGLDRSFDFNEGKGFFGASYKADFGQTYLVTHSVPRERPITLGCFQHALANGVEKWWFTGPNAGVFHDRILQPPVTHAIGNSFAVPCIAPDQTTGTFNTMPAVDHSWLANDALWDQWFVSSLSQRSAPHHTADQTGTARSLFEGLAGIGVNTRLLPNKHYRYTGGNPTEDVNVLFDRSDPKPDAFRLLAPMLRIHGAFNVNSTDPAAWLAMFRSTGGMRVPIEPSAESRRSWESAKNPIASLLVPKGSAALTSELADPASEDQWTGYRDATDQELKELADAMVEEVRKRGPFLSLADFVNRRLVTDPDLASRGALQAALDRSINKDLETGARSISGTSRGPAFPAADKGALMTHVPGHVKQGDILTTIGTRLSPRSDTFTIRAYGESRSPAGELLASARCEAVVQREAGYVDPADAPDVLPANLRSEGNKKFGRKFSLVAFRWIPQGEP